MFFLARFHPQNSGSLKRGNKGRLREDPLALPAPTGVMESINRERAIGRCFVPAVTL